MKTLNTQLFFTCLPRRDNRIIISSSYKCLVRENRLPAGYWRITRLLKFMKTRQQNRFRYSGWKVKKIQQMLSGIDSGQDNLYSKARNTQGLIEPALKIETLHRSWKSRKRTVIRKFINCLIRGGKRAKILKSIFYSFSSVSQVHVPVELLIQSISSVRPIFHLRKRRVGGAIYQVPYILPEAKQDSMAIGWVIQSIFNKKRQHPSHRLHNLLVTELVDCLDPSYNSIGHKTRDEMHKKAIANRFAAYYRWW